MFTIQMNPLDSHGGPPVPIPVSEMFHLAEDRAGDLVHTALQHRGYESSHTSRNLRRRVW